MTFEEARALVQRRLGPTWGDNGEQGVFYVDIIGAEDEHGYLLNFGAEESLVDGDPRYLVADYGIALVDKRTGKLTTPNYLAEQERIDAMTPVQVQ